MKGAKRRPLALSIYINNRGYGFTLFEGADRAVDWGTRDIRAKHGDKRFVSSVAGLLDCYRPSQLVLEEWRARHCSRPKRIRLLNRKFEQLGKRRELEVLCYARKAVDAHFEGLGASTRHERALEVAARVPALAFWAPPERELWTSEHPRMPIFDAAMLNMTHFRGDV